MSSGSQSSPTSSSAKLKNTSVAEFTVEFGDERNRSIILRTLRQEVRGHFSLRKFYETDHGGRAIGEAMSRVPDIPGEFLAIIPKDNKAIFYDPWEKKPEQWDRLNAALEQALPARSGKYGPKTRIETTLTDDQLVTLVKEVVQLVEEGKARVVKGKLPDEKEMSKLEGRELFDPMNSGRKPRYRDEVEAWERRIDSAVG